MHTITTRAFGVFVVLALAAGCSQSDAGEGEDAELVEQGKIIGSNDLTPVTGDGANLPKKYRSIVDSFGVLSMGCTATHIGNGLMLTAGHCFNAPATRKDNVACPNVTVKWGVRKDKPSYLTSTCSIVLAEEWNANRDYAIVKVSPVPDAFIDVDFAERPAVGTEITIFGHPRRRPLEWSKTCPLKAASEGGWGLDQFSHQCDTEPASSGSTILDDTTLKVIGIHDGGNTKWNYGTYLANTPIAEFVTPTN